MRAAAAIRWRGAGTRRNSPPSRIGWSAECGAQIVLVGTKSDDNAAVKAAMRADALDLSGQTSLAELAAVLKAATCSSARTAA